MDLNIYPQLPNKRDWRIGCIGSGFIMSECHLPNYQAANYNLYAISTSSENKAKELKDKFGFQKTYSHWKKLLADPHIEVLDIAVPPQAQLEIVRKAVTHKNIKGILAQKPLGTSFTEAQEIVTLCEHAGIQLVVNQNMRYDHSIRALKTLVDQQKLGELVLGSIDMRAIPHWAPWQEELGWLTLRIMSIHHLDCARYIFGDPVKVFCSTTKDPRTKFEHSDGICLTTLEFENGARFQITDDVWAGPAREGAAEDCYINWRVEGHQGLAKGTIGWPKWPKVEPSTLSYSTVESQKWLNPSWEQAWFPHAFLGPMSELLCSLEGSTSSCDGKDNLRTMLLVEACYLSAKDGRVVDFKELCEQHQLNHSNVPLRKPQS